MKWQLWGLLSLFLLWALGGHTATSRIVFTSLAQAMDSQYEAIFIANADGTDVKLLTRAHGHNAFLPVLSPDGTHIACAADSDNSTQIFIMQSDGTGMTKLTKTGSNYTPGFSPDGKQLVFHSLRDGNRELYLINADGTGEKRLTNNTSEDRNASFTPDGKHILFQSDREDGRWQIYTMTLDGMCVQRLTNLAGDCTDPVFSPDGQHIAFTFNLPVVEDWDDRRAQLYVMKADGSDVKQVGVSKNGASHPSFSPDSTQIVYQDGPFYSSRLMIIDRDGQNAHDLFPPDGPDGWSPGWGMALTKE